MKESNGEIKAVHLLPLQRVQKVSKYMRITCSLIGGIFIILCIVQIIMAWSGTGHLSVGPPTIQWKYNMSTDGIAPLANGVLTADLSTIGKLIFTLGFTLTVGLILKGVYHLYILFTNYAQGEIFSGQATKEIKQLGITICLWAALPAIDGLTKLFMFFSEGSNGVLGVTINANPFLIFILLFVGASVILVSWVMDTGREISEEQEFTV
jgi:hypothetical protein